MDTKSYLCKMASIVLNYHDNGMDYDIYEIFQNYGRPIDTFSDEDLNYFDTLI